MSAPSSPSPRSASAESSVRAARRRVRSAATFARINAWTMLIGALLAALLGFLHWEGFALGAALLICTALEFRGAAGLDRLDPGAPGRLAANQFGLITLAWAYCLWRFFAALSGTNPVIQQAFEISRTGDPEYDDAMRSLLPLAAGIVYGVVALSVTLVCGVTAWYYLSRRGWVRQARAGA
ncbi:MAG: hypothetical protein AB7K52_08090 [Phycisphaerales bacterium]